MSDVAQSSPTRVDVDRRFDLGVLLLVLTGVLITAGYLAMGTGFVLDDWFALSNAHFDGAWSAAGPDQLLARPGGAVTYALTFGLIGSRPALHLVIQMALVVATALALRTVGRRTLQGRWTADLLAFIWLVFPNRMSLEVWASAVNIALALFVVTLAAVIWSRGVSSRNADLLAALLVGVACLTYEAVAPLAVVAALGLPWMVSGRPRWRALFSAVAAVGIAIAWILMHMHPEKESSGLVDPTLALGAHFGWGIAPGGWIADAVLMGALVGVLLVVYVTIKESRSTIGAERAAASQELGLVVGGLGIVAVGILPFLTYFYEPVGAGDRVNVVSAIGGAMVWTGLLTHLWRQRHAAAVVVGCLLLLVSVTARIDRMAMWSTAGADGRAILAATLASVPDPEGEIVFGPVPVVQSNLAVFVDNHNNVRPALRLLYDDPSIDGSIAHSIEEFCASDAPHKIDLHELSELVPHEPLGNWSCPEA